MAKLPIIKSKITYLEMIENPEISEASYNGYELRFIPLPTYEFYINLYRDIGRDYIWNYRPGQSEEEVTSLIQSDENLLYCLFKGETAVGMAEIDINNDKDIEIIHFGLLPEYTEQGIGRIFFHNILFQIWSKSPSRVWLATCGLDHPNAVSFYKNAGFSVAKETAGDFYDYRYSDFYNKDDAPQIPLAG